MVLAVLNVYRNDILKAMATQCAEKRLSLERWLKEHGPSEDTNKCLKDVLLVGAEAKSLPSDEKHPLSRTRYVVTDREKSIGVVIKVIFVSLIVLCHILCGVGYPPVGVESVPYVFK